MSNIDTSPAIPPAAYNIDETCAVIGLGRDAIYRAIRQGKLRMRKFGKRSLILRTDIDEFLQALPVGCAQGNPVKRRSGEGTAT
jgi:excisionase family DNA binding protein